MAYEVRVEVDAGQCLGSSNNGGGGIIFCVLLSLVD